MARKQAALAAMLVLLLGVTASCASAAPISDPSIDEVISTLKALKSGTAGHRSSGVVLSTTPEYRRSAPQAAAYLDAAPEFEFESAKEELSKPLPDPTLAAAAAGMDATPAKPAAAAATAKGAEPAHAPQFPADQPQQQQQQQQAAAGKKPISSLPAEATPLPAKDQVKQEQPQQQQEQQVQQKQQPAPAAAPQKPEQPAQQQQKPVQPAPQQPAKPAPAPVVAPATPKPAAVAPKQPEAPKKAAEPAPAKKAAEPAPAKKAEEPAKKAEEPAKKAEEPKKEDPCKQIPGCVACKPAGPSITHTFTRKLRQFGGGMSGFGGEDAHGNGGNKKGQRPNFDQLFSGIESVYNSNSLPVCTACNTTAGYVAHSKGRCACAPGFGDTSPSGVCAKCPGGYFSNGGFRALCVECTGVAYANADRTACVCASGWYGLTSYATKQASCNQCPGSRPVAIEGSRSSSECKACPEGFKPNEVFSQCINASIPLHMNADAELDRLVDSINGNTSTPNVKPLFNESTFEDAREKWTITTRNTQNFSNPVTDIFGSIMDSIFSGKNITPTAKAPGDLLYQILTKPTAQAPKMPSLPAIDLQNPQQLGAGLGAALATAPKVLSAAAQNGGRIQDVVDSVAKAVETGTQKAAAMQPPAGAAGSSAGGWGDFIKGLTATAPADSTGKNSWIDLAKNVGDIFSSATKAANSVAEQVVTKGDTSMLSGLLGAGSAPAPANDWASLLGGMFGGAAAAAPAPAPVVPAPGPTGAGDWASLLGGLTKSAPAASADAPADAAGGDSHADIAKMLASLTAPAAKVVNANPHTITVDSRAGSYGAAPAAQLSSLSSLPNAGGALPNLMGSTLPAASMNDPDMHQKTSKTVEGGGAKKKAVNSAKGKASFSFSNAEGSKGKQVGFIAVPSAPPKAKKQQ